MAIDAAKIHKSLRRLRRATAKLSKEPSPEIIHKLRTSALKLEAIFGTLSLDSQKNERRLIQELRRIRKRAGKLRDIDVLTADLAAVHLDGETECQVQILEHLGGNRRRQAGKLRNLIRDRRAKLKAHLRRASTNLDKALHANKPELASLAAAESLRLSSELKLPKRLNKRNLHAYRLKLKQLRYVLELAPDRPKFVDDLGEAKNAIGEWHDWEELVVIANEVLDHGTNCKLLRKLKETADLKFEHAVRVTEKLRRTYVKSSSQNGKRPHRVELSSAAVRASVAFSEDVSRAA
jgi:CHAD domain-containing protein